jgi:hypothetical protein
LFNENSNRLVLAVLRRVLQHLRRRILAVCGRGRDVRVAAADQRGRDAVERQVLIVGSAGDVVRSLVDEVERHAVGARRALVLIRVGLIADRVVDEADARADALRDLPFEVYGRWVELGCLRFGSTRTLLESALALNVPASFGWKVRSLFESVQL